MTKILKKDEVFLSSDQSIVERRLLVEVREQVSKLIEQYGDDAEIRFDGSYNSIEESVVFRRMETDDEYAERLQKEAKLNQAKLDREAKRDLKRQQDAQAKEARERELLSLLINKYGVPHVE